MSIADEIEKLSRLRESGALTEEEYQRAKASLLARNDTAGEKLGRTVDRLAGDVNTWGMLIHLSQLLNWAMPPSGLIVPIILWQIKKDESDLIDRHGKIVVNWIISTLIYGVVFLPLCLVFIGIPLMMALIVASIALPIIGGLKAKQGEVWEYPLSFRFFR